MEDGERQMVTVMGEPGLGKSRLLYEFENWADLQPTRCSFSAAGRARKRAALPYGLLRDLFAFRFDIQDDDPAAVVRENLTAGFAAHTGCRRDERAQRPHPGPAARLRLQRQPARAADPGRCAADPRPGPDVPGALLQSRGSTSPRGDPARRPALGRRLLAGCPHATGHGAGRPASSAARRRPTGALRTPARIGSKAKLFTSGSICSPSQSATAGAWWTMSCRRWMDLPEALRELVVSNAEGNPFYVEELIKMLIEEGVIVKGEADWRVRVRPAGRGARAADPAPACCKPAWTACQRQSGSCCSRPRWWAGFSGTLCWRT